MSVNPPLSLGVGETKPNHTPLVLHCIFMYVMHLHEASGWIVHQS